MRYAYLLVDNDNTLMDFDLAEELALRETLEAHDIPADEEHVSAYHRINEQKWKDLEKKLIDLKTLKISRFEDFVSYCGIQNVSAATLCDDYENTLSRHAELLPDALLLLETLHDRGVKIALVTNGIARIQHSRVERSGFQQWLDALVISEEIGFGKPDPRVVEEALRRLGCTEKKQAVFLGDSLSSDIAAANAAGIDSIRYGADTDRATYSVRGLREALELILGE